MKNPFLLDRNPLQKRILPFLTSNRPRLGVLLFISCIGIILFLEYSPIYPVLSHLLVILGILLVLSVILSIVKKYRITKLVLFIMLIVILMISFMERGIGVPGTIQQQMYSENKIGCILGTVAQTPIIKPVLDDPNQSKLTFRFHVTHVVYTNFAPDTLTSDDLTSDDLTSDDLASDDLTSANYTLTPSSGTLQVYYYFPTSEYEKMSCIKQVRLGTGFFLKGVYKPYGELYHTANYKYIEYLQRSRIDGLLYPQSEADMVYFPTENQWYVPLIQAIEPVQHAIRNTIQHNFSSDSSSLILGIILGEKSSMDPELYKSFQQTGTAHILAVSGLHVGILALMFIVFFRIFRVSTRVSMILVIPILFFYLFLVGVQISALRAILMYTIMVVMVRLLDRDRDYYNLLAWAGIIILLINPNDLTSIGFQLSFTAVFGIFFLFSRISLVLDRYRDRKPHALKQRVWERLKYMLASGSEQLLKMVLLTFSVQFMLAPFLVYYFEILPLIGMLANVGAVFFLWISIGFLALYVLFAWIHPWLEHTIRIGLDGMIQGLYTWIEPFTASWGWVAIPREDYCFFLMIYLGIAIPLFTILFWVQYKSPTRVL